jgi:DNA mismatch repair protein MutL
VNGRFIRDRGAAYAVLRAFAGSLPAGRHPAGVLLLDLPPDRVDVNVHPQKLEVRFADARAAYDAVHHAVADALRPAPWLRHREGAGAPPPPPPGALPAASVAAEPVAGDEPEGVRAVLEAARLGPGASPRLPFPAPAAEFPAPAFAPPEAPRPAAGYFASLRYVGQHARTYLLCEGPGGSLVVIDQHASHERLLFHRLREAHRARRPETQPFLVPPVVRLPPAAARAVEAGVEDLRHLGLEVEPFGGDDFAVQAAPALLAAVPMQPLLVDLASQLEEASRASAVEEARDGLLATMACHAAVRANQDLSREEARALLDGLDAVEFKARCPHGRPVVFELSLAELERRVGRR